MKKIIPLFAIMVATVLLLTGCLGAGKNTEVDPNAPPTFAAEPGDDRFIGDFEVEVESVSVVPRNNKESMLVARIRYTNHTEENVIFKENLSVVMFQDGIMLSDMTPGATDGYDFESVRKTIKPGATIIVDLAFKPKNLTSAVEVEVYAKGQYYVDAKAKTKVRADYYGAVMELGGGQFSNTADTIAAERQTIMDEWEAEQARLAAEAAAAAEVKNKD